MKVERIEGHLNPAWVQEQNKRVAAAMKRVEQTNVDLARRIEERYGEQGR